MSEHHHQRRQLVATKLRIDNLSQVLLLIETILLQDYNTKLLLLLITQKLLLRYLFIQVNQTKMQTILQWVLLLIKVLNYRMNYLILIKITIGALIIDYLTLLMWSQNILLEKLEAIIMIIAMTKIMQGQVVGRSFLIQQIL